MSTTSPLTFGILGAAGITPLALLEPAQDRDDVRVVAVAARERSRAEEFAQEHGIPQVLDDYQAVLDSDVEAVYIPLHNSAHAEWAIKALQAGKHVLLEKPFADNADQAREVAAVADGIDRVLMEAFHYRHHALWHRLDELLRSGVIGDLVDASAVFEIHLPDRSNIRYQSALAGGATMDLGCYAIHLLRSLLGSEPTVVTAVARTTDDPELDEALTAQLTFPGGISSTITSSLLEEVEAQSARFTGTQGHIDVEGFVHPQSGNRITVTVDGESTEESVPAQPSSYAAQLDVFVKAVREGGPVIPDPADSIKTMEVIDAMYVAAGLHRRGDF